MVNDGMERRRYGLDPPLGPFKGNWDQAEFTLKEQLYNERLYIGQMKPAE